MRKPFWLAIVFAGLTAVAGCAGDPNATEDIPEDRAPLTSPGVHTLNSPTTGPSGSGLSGGTEASAPPDFIAPDRGTRVR